MKIVYYYIKLINYYFFYIKEIFIPQNINLIHIFFILYKFEIISYKFLSKKFIYIFFK